MRYPHALLTSLFLFTATASFAADFQPVSCEGAYPHHLQGVCTDEKESIFWSFTTKLVKTDRTGKVVKQVDVENHHGDLCFHDGKVFVAVNLGKFNDAQESADSWVCVYDADKLNLLSEHQTPNLKFGAGGIAFHNGRFIVVGGLAENFQGNSAYEFDDKFRTVKQHRFKTAYTLMGIQTAAFADGHWWFGCYGDPKILLKEDEFFSDKGQRFEFDCSLGIVPVGEGRFLVARGEFTKDKGHTGKLVLAVPDKQSGLKLVEK
jgi:hypothetical protein